MDCDQSNPRWKNEVGQADDAKSFPSHVLTNSQFEKSKVLPLLSQ